MIEAEVTGIEEFQRLLNEVATVGATKAASKGIRAGLKVIEDAQVAAAPVGTPGRKTSKGEPITPGGVKRSIGSRFAKGRAEGFQTAKAGLNVKARLSKKGLRAYHAHLVALGTKQRQTKTGANRGRMPANPFIRTATQSVESQALETTKRVTLEALDAEVRKAGLK